MRRTVATLALATALGIQASAQDDPNQRDYGEAKAFAFDLDANGTPDRLQPRTFAKRAGRIEKHFVAFDWHPDGGAKRATILEYEYGTSEADYWGYTLKDAGDLDGDGRRDLLFSTGDDASFEDVVLLNRSEGFLAVSPGAVAVGYEVTDALDVVEMPDGERAPRVLARWDGSRRAFVGDGMKWTKAARTVVRKSPSLRAAAVESLDAGEPVVVDAGARPAQQGWVKVTSMYGGEGWVRDADLSDVTAATPAPR
jgi:hypothetical protein